MAIQIQGNNGVIAEVDGTLFRALRVATRPLDYGTLGHYSVGVITGAYVALAANAVMFSMRWTDATRFCVVYRFGVTVQMNVAGTAAAVVDRALFFVRGWTPTSDSGGTTITLTGNNAKTRTDMGTSLMGDMRVMTTGALTLGSGTNDAQALAKATATQLTGAITTGLHGLLIPPTNLIEDNAGFSHPIVLATNEGLRVLNPNIGGAAASLFSTFNPRWAEVTAF